MTDTANCTAEHEDSSTDLCLRHHVPIPIARAYRRMEAPGLNDTDKWSRTLSFVDTSLRFLVGVMCCEALGLKMPLPHDAQTLIKNKLHAPSYGDWSRAAFALSDALFDAGCLFPCICKAFGKERARTDFAQSYFRIVGERNDLAHQEIPFPGEAQARQILKAYQSDLSVICNGLRHLRAHALFVLHSSTHGRSGAEARALLCMGEELRKLAPARLSHVPRVPVMTPLLLGSDGRVLTLSPFLIVDQDPQNGALDVRLVSYWNSKKSTWMYSTAIGWQPTPSSGHCDQGDVHATREGWLGDPSSTYRLDERIPRELGATIAAGTVLDEALALPGFIDVSHIGHGSTSTVYRARRKVSGRMAEAFVALKVLNPWVAGNHDVVGRLRRECEILSLLQHPGIVKVEGYYSEPTPHIVMEYVQGPDLHAWISTRHPNGVETKVAERILLEVLSALGTVHKHGVVHRDIKPRNILLDGPRDNERPRLIDFGIALAERVGHETAAHDFLGTFDYAAPEQLRRDRGVDARADIFSLGRLLHFLLSGDIRSDVNALPPGAQAIIRRATSADPEDRFQSAAEMEEAITERSELEWGGAPVQTGTRVARSYCLGALRATQDGIYAYDAIEIATNQQLGALVGAPAIAGDESGATRLASAVRTLSPSTRVALGFPRTIHADGGLLLVVVSEVEPQDALAAVLTDRAPAPAVLAETDDIGGNPPFLPALRALHRQWKASSAVTAVEVLNGAEIVRRATLALCAHVALGAGRPPSLGEWREMSGAGFGRAVAGLQRLMRDLEAAHPLVLDGPATLQNSVLDLKWLARQRNEIAHSMGAAVQTFGVTRYIAGIQELMELGARLHTALGNKICVAPWVVERGEGNWYVLEFSLPRGHYVPLCARRAQLELDAEARAWMDQEMRLAAQQSTALVADLAERSLRSTIAQLAKLPGVLDAVSDSTTHAIVDGVRFAEVLLRGSAGALAVVEVHLHAHVGEANALPTEAFARLERRAARLGVQFAGYADGTEAVWLRARTDGRLETLPACSSPPWA